MKLQVRIDGELVTGGVKHLSRKPNHELTVRVLDKDGELIELQREQVECELPGARRERGPNSLGATATFAFPSVRLGRIECAYKYERARIRVVGFYTGLIWSTLALLILCAPIAGAVALKTVIHLDSDLKLFETAAQNAFQLFGFGSGLLGLVVGLPVVQETIKSKSADPVLSLLLSPAGTVALLISLALAVLMVDARPRIYTNATSSDIAVPGGGVWKPHELWLLGRESWIEHPLSVSSNPLSENDLEQWLAGQQVKCASWWPKIETDGQKSVPLQLSNGCTKVIASAKSKLAQIQVTLGTSSGEQPSPAQLMIDDTGLTVSLNPDELLTGSIALLGRKSVSGERLSLELGPGTSLSKDVELQEVRLKGTFDALDRRRLVLPVKNEGLLHASLRTDAPSSALMGELSCVATTNQTLVFISSPTLQLKEAQLIHDHVWLSSWSQKSSQLQTFVGMCLPQGSREFVLVLEVGDRWQPDPSWQLELPAEISRVDLRLADGRLLGSASFQCPVAKDAVCSEREQCDKPWLLATHYLDGDDASSGGRGLRHFRNIKDAAGYGEWQRPPEDTGLHRQWFWLPDSAAITGKEQQCRGSFDYPSRTFPCPAGKKAQYPARTCYFDNGRLVAGCAQGARAPQGDEAPDNLRAGCDKVLVCAG